MGWLWGAATPATDRPITQTTLPEPSQRPSSTTSSTSPQHTAPIRELTRDEIAEAELKSFLEELEADARPSSTKYNRVPRIPPTGNIQPQDTTNQSLEDQLLPQDMSCRQAFDAAFYCQSLGGQFNNLYRYGGIRSCSENWRDFWFCMKTKSTGDQQRQDMIREHYKRKALKYKLGHSSEDIWESREKKMEWGEAFAVPIAEQAGSDEEWNRKERTRREIRVRETKV